MSTIVNEAVEQLNAKMAGQSYDGTAKFVIEGEGAVMIDETGARAADEASDVTLTSDADTFRAILEGEQNPTAAFMTGRLKVDGDMGQAMKLSAILA